MTPPQVLFIGEVILIGSIEKRFIFMANWIYHWIQDDGPHKFAIRRKECHHRERKFKYFMLENYADRGLCVHSPHGLTPGCVFIHK